MPTDFQKSFASTSLRSEVVIIAKSNPRAVMKRKGPVYAPATPASKRYRFDVDTNTSNSLQGLPTFQNEKVYLTIVHKSTIHNTTFELKPEDRCFGIFDAIASKLKLNMKRVLLLNERGILKFGMTVGESGLMEDNTVYVVDTIRDQRHDCQNPMASRPVSGRSDHHYRHSFHPYGRLDKTSDYNVQQQQHRPISAHQQLPNSPRRPASHPMSQPPDSSQSSLSSRRPNSQTSIQSPQLSKVTPPTTTNTNTNINNQHSATNSATTSVTGASVTAPAPTVPIKSVSPSPLPLEEDTSSNTLPQSHDDVQITDRNDNHNSETQTDSPSDSQTESQTTDSEPQHAVQPVSGPPRPPMAVPTPVQAVQPMQVPTSVPPPPPPPHSYSQSHSYSHSDDYYHQQHDQHSQHSEYHSYPSVTNGSPQGYTLARRGKDIVPRKKKPISEKVKYLYKTVSRDLGDVELTEVIVMDQEALKWWRCSSCDLADGITQKRNSVRVRSIATHLRSQQHYKKLTGHLKEVDYERRRKEAAEQYRLKEQHDKEYGMVTLSTGTRDMNTMPPKPPAESVRHVERRKIPPLQRECQDPSHEQTAA